MGTIDPRPLKAFVRFDGRSSEATYNVEVLQLKCSRPPATQLSERNNAGGTLQTFGSTGNVQIRRLLN